MFIADIMIVATVVGALLIVAWPLILQLYVGWRVTMSILSEPDYETGEDDEAARFFVEGGPEQ